MRKIVIVFLFVVITNQLFSQSLKDLSFGTDSTLEVITWNIEHFPKNGQSTIDSVIEVIEALDADVIAFQEIDNLADFNNMLSSLSGYSGQYSNKLAYIYKTSTITISSIHTIYSSSTYSRQFPRRPFVMEMSFQNKDFIIINNHLKCCGSSPMDLSDPWDEETRRFDANNLLDTYIKNTHPTKKIISVGDQNDVLTDIPANNVFQTFINDTAGYLFTDMDIANLGNSSTWSYPTWPSHIDHIMISNELFYEYALSGSETKTIRIEDYLTGGFSSYDYNISDHRPVAIKIKTDSNYVGIDDLESNQLKIKVYPNPSNGSKSLFITELKQNMNVKIFNSLGEEILIQQTRSNSNIDIYNLQNGMYFAVIFKENQRIASQKLIIN